MTGIIEPSDALPTTRVAVIGLGAAGIAQLKQLVDAFSRPEVAKRTKLEVIAYESRDGVGGIWNYNPHPKPFIRKHPPPANGYKESPTYLYPPKGEDPTPMYDDLRVNLPSDLMSYRGDSIPVDEQYGLFPPRHTVLNYLRSYTKKYRLDQYIRFNTRVQRLRHTDASDGSESSAHRQWIIEAECPEGRSEEAFDYVSVANGHYSDVWIPDIPGLKTFPGRIVHSREYRRPSDHAGQSTLVVGAYASGNDIARHLASLNIDHYTASGEPSHHSPPQPFTRLYQSSTGAPNAQKSGDTTEPWAGYIHQVPIISHLTEATETQPALIHFTSTPFSHPPLPVNQVDTIIFATGYNNSLPFCRATDVPWSKLRILDRQIQPHEREGGDEWEIGGFKGVHMTHLDELLLFLKGYRSLAFPALQYQVAPFPFAEVQARLISLLWAGLLPNFPAHPTPPPNTSNPYVNPVELPAPALPDGIDTTHAPSSAPIRQVFSTRRELVFPNPYEWEYVEYIFSLTQVAEGESEEYWRKVEEWRKQRRADTGLRKRTLGY